MQGCICPHPPLLIPEVGADSRKRIGATVTAMEQLAELVGEPETVIVISPHTHGYADAFTVKTASRLHGDFSSFRRPEASFTYECDQPFAELLLALGGEHRQLSVAPENDGELDWGVLVPLSFLPVRRLVSLSIVSDYETHQAFGQLIRRCAEELGRDALFVASGDLSHALIPSAPAGYDPRGQLFDDEVVSLVGAGRFTDLMTIDSTVRRGAAECGLRSFITLGGFLGDDAVVAPRVLSYEGPFGVGYLVAHYGRGEE